MSLGDSVERLKSRLFSVGGGKAEYFLAGALGIIIIGALVMTLEPWHWVSHASGPTPQLIYKCSDPNCGFEFPVDKPVIDPNLPPGRPPSFTLDCPQCGGKQCCWPTAVCPNCGGRYIPESSMFMVRRNFRPGVMEQDHDKCPHCGIDIQEWYRTHPRKSQ